MKPNSTPPDSARSMVARPSITTQAMHMIRGVFHVAIWMVLILAVLITSFLTGWILLAAVLLGGGQMVANLMLLALVVVSGALAWLVARYVTSPRNVLLTIALTLVVTILIATTWVLSAPKEAVFLARDLAWPGGNVREYLTYPQRTINNAPIAFHFNQDLSPEQFQNLEYRLGGQPMTAPLDKILSSTQTTSFIIIKDGVIRYEGYSNGYSRDSIVTSFSIAKSVTSALIGIAIDEGYINSIDDPITYYLPELRGKGLDGMTIKDLLSMSTGIRFTHKDEFPPLVRMLPFDDMARMTSFPDLRSVALSVKPDGDSPGEAWKYNDFYPQLLGIILERTTHKSVSEFLQEKIWKPLGMEFPASWSLDSQKSGFEHMESGLNARAIDFAKFGVLFLNNGNWNGHQIISDRWVSESTLPDPEDNRPWRIHQDWKDAHGYYKYLWWGKLRPDGTYYYMARGGFNQQWIYISPSDGVVIVRFGLREEDVTWWPDIFEGIAATLR